MARNAAISEAEKVEFETMPWLETFLVASVDVALAAQNAVVAAESIGLGTVYIGAMRNEPEKVADLLGLPPQCFVLFGLCVGYATEQAEGEVKPRMPQAMMLHHERYDASNADAHRQAHDAEMMRFSARQEMQAGDLDPARPEPAGADQVDERSRAACGKRSIAWASGFAERRPAGSIAATPASLPCAFQGQPALEKESSMILRPACSARTARSPLATLAGASVALALRRPAPRPRPPHQAGGKPPAAAAATSSKPRPSSSASPR